MRKVGNSTNWCFDTLHHCRVTKQAIACASQLQISVGFCSLVLAKQCACIGSLALSPPMAVGPLTGADAGHSTINDDAEYLCAAHRGGNLPCCVPTQIISSACAHTDARHEVQELLFASVYFRVVFQHALSGVALLHSCVYCAFAFSALACACFSCGINVCFANSL